MGKIDENRKVLSRKSNSLEVTVETSFLQLELIREEWDEFVVSVDGGIYFSYDWCKIWWDHYAYKRKMKVFLFRDNGKLVGILPMIIDRIWVGIIRVTLAKLLGSDSTLSVFNLPVQEDYAERVFGLLCGDLCKSENVDLIWFGKISGDNNLLDSLRKDSRNLTNMRVVYDAKGEYHTVLNLPESYDKYLANISKSQRKKFRQGVNRLKKNFDFEFLVSKPASALDSFREFCILHEKQWHCKKKLGHFGDWPKSVRFHEALVKTFAQKNLVRIAKISVDKEDIVFKYCLNFGKVTHWLLPARHPGKEWSRFRLGQVMFFHMVEDAINENYTTIDDGQGQYAYKLKFGARERPLQSVLLQKNSFMASVKGQLFLGFSKFLNKVYYRLWFHRLMPCLPIVFRRPLWTLWIRTRI